MKKLMMLAGGLFLLTSAFAGIPGNSDPTGTLHVTVTGKCTACTSDLNGNLTISCSPDPNSTCYTDAGGTITVNGCPCSRPASPTYFISFEFQGGPNTYTGDGGVKYYTYSGVTPL